MSEEDTGAPHFATGAEVEALLINTLETAWVLIRACSARSAGMSITRTKGVPKRQ